MLEDHVAQLKEISFLLYKTEDSTDRLSDIERQINRIVSNLQLSTALIRICML